MGEIIRVVEYQPGKFRYGFLFAQLKESELTELTRTLYNVQVGNVIPRRRSDDTFRLKAGTLYPLLHSLERRHRALVRRRFGIMGGPFPVCRERAFCT